MFYVSNVSCISTTKIFISVLSLLFIGGALAHEEEKPNVLVPIDMLKTELRIQNIEFDDWENDWKYIDKFYCRTLPCFGCLSCQLLCQNYALNLSVGLDSWNECEYPYGFSIDSRLSGEQQAIIAIIFLLATIFLICAFYVLRIMFIENDIHIKETSQYNELQVLSPRKLVVTDLDSSMDALFTKACQSKISSPCERDDYPWGKHVTSLETKKSSLKDTKPKELYTPVLLSVK